jgi:hypothetical protein
MSSHLVTCHMQRDNSLFSGIEKRAAELMDVLRRKKKSRDAVQLSPLSASVSGVAAPFVSPSWPKHCRITSHMSLIAWHSHTSLTAWHSHTSLTAWHSHTSLIAWHSHTSLTAWHSHTSLIAWHSHTSLIAWHRWHRQLAPSLSWAGVRASCGRTRRR